uniref:HAP1 N-terminal domain-containing protein n=1 Tax=Ciona savignyi TaxID=51511 RepID=H2Y5X6_CIOSA
MQEHSKVHLKHSMVDNGAAMEDSLFPFIGDNYNSFVRTPDEEQSDHEVDSMPECQIDLTEVDVYTRLEHKERDLILAAELGKSLLEKNEFLTRENERVQNEFQDRCEILEQQKHELRQRLEFKESEWDANSAQLNSDIKRAQEELEEHKAMLCAAEREKSRAVDELTQQNQKLLSQLQKSCEAERQLSIQVQQLR